MAWLLVVASGSALPCHAGLDLVARPTVHQPVDAGSLAEWFLRASTHEPPCDRRAARAGATASATSSSSRARPTPRASRSGSSRSPPAACSRSTSTTTEDDAFYILEGEMTFFFGDEEVAAPPGTFVLVPPGVAHGFRNDGDVAGADAQHPRAGRLRPADRALQRGVGEAMKPPKTQYARSGDFSIAYQVVGDGPLDLVHVPGLVSHLDHAWTHPEVRALHAPVASFARVILYDKRGTGLSDPSSSRPRSRSGSTTLRAVMDAVGCDRAALFGCSEGGRWRASSPPRTPSGSRADRCCGTFARATPGPPDHPGELTTS